MTIVTTTYSADTPIGFDISGLTPSPTFVAGYESDEVNNSVNKYIDALVNVEGITGDSSQAPAVGQYIGLWCWGANVSLGTTPIDTLDGTGSNEVLSHVSVLRSLKFVDAPAVTEATTSLVYYIQPFSVAQLFGGILPKFWGLFLAHNHNGNLGLGQTGLFSYNGITYTNT